VEPSARERGNRYRPVSPRWVVARGLLLIDFEEEWRTTGSEAYLGDLRPPLTNARRLLDAAREAGLPIVFTRHEEPGGSTIFGPGSAGAQIIPELAPRDGEAVIVKHRISPFYGTPLEGELAHQKIDHLLICGIMTNLCVRSAVSDAYDRQLGITLITDACASDSALTDEFTFKDLHTTRPEVRLVTTDELLRELLPPPR
jgi:nicotinamidase-related amidase